LQKNPKSQSSPSLLEAKMVIDSEIIEAPCKNPAKILSKQKFAHKFSVNEAKN
jgi:hypothetical protein